MQQPGNLRITIKHLEERGLLAYTQAHYANTQEIC